MTPLAKRTSSSPPPPPKFEKVDEPLLEDGTTLQPHQQIEVDGRREKFSFLRVVLDPAMPYVECRSERTGGVRCIPVEKIKVRRKSKVLRLQST